MGACYKIYIIMNADDSTLNLTWKLAKSLCFCSKIKATWVNGESKQELFIILYNVGQ